MVNICRPPKKPLQKELTKLKEKLEASKLRQEADLKEQLARRRQQKLLEAKKRQDLRKRQVRSGWS